MGRLERVCDEYASVREQNCGKLRTLVADRKSVPNIKDRFAGPADLSSAATQDRSAYLHRVCRLHDLQGIGTASL